jgi:hypothetical protein
MLRRIAPSLLGSAALMALIPAPAHAAAPYNGWGFGVADPDYQPARSLDHRFQALRPKTFRFIVNWNIADDPGLKAQALARIQLARAAGVEEVAVSFGTPPAYVDPFTWAAKVFAFVNEFSPHVEWWSPVNEPNHLPREGTNWLRERPDVAASYSNLLAWHLAAFHPDDRLLSPDFHDDYDDDLGDGTPLRTMPGQGVSTVSDYITRYAAAGGRFGEMVAWHPYSGVKRRSMASTEDFTRTLGTVGAGSLPIWITEVGALEGPGQGEQLEFVVRQLSQAQPVKRLSYWHMFDHNDGWDSALIARDRTLRPAWYTWCAASHGNDRSHPDCAVPPLPRRVAIAAEDASLRLDEGHADGHWSAASPDVGARDVELQADRLAAIKADGSTWINIGPAPGSWHQVADASWDAWDVELNDHDRLAIVAADGTIWLIKGVPSGAPPLPIGPAILSPRDIELDGDRIVVAAGDGTVWYRDGLETGAWVRLGGPELEAADVEVAGDRVAVIGGEGRLWLKRGLSAGGWERLRAPGAVTDIELTRDRLAALAGDGRVMVVGTGDTSEWHDLGLDAMRIALHGERLAAVKRDGSVWLNAGLSADGWHFLGGAGLGAVDVALF